MQLVGGLGGLAEELSRHSEVGHDRVPGVQREPQVLAAAADVQDLPLGQYGGEVPLAGQVPADRAGVVYLGGGDGTTDEPPGQALAYRLDLGKLGHVRSRTSIRRPGRRRTRGRTRRTRPAPAPRPGSGTGLPASRPATMSTQTQSAAAARRARTPTPRTPRHAPAG